MKNCFQLQILGETVDHTLLYTVKDVKRSFHSTWNELLTRQACTESNSRTLRRLNTFNECANLKQLVSLCFTHRQMSPRVEEIGHVLLLIMYLRSIFYDYYYL